MSRPCKLAPRSTFATPWGPMTKRLVDASVVCGVSNGPVHLRRPSMRHPVTSRRSRPPSRRRSLQNGAESFSSCLQKGQIGSKPTTTCELPERRSSWIGPPMRHAKPLRLDSGPTVVLPKQDAWQTRNCVATTGGQPPKMGFVENDTTPSKTNGDRAEDDRRSWTHRKTGSPSDGLAHSSDRLCGGSGATLATETPRNVQHGGCTGDSS